MPDLTAPLVDPRFLVCVLTPCKDIPGEWLAHCLTTDIITQGAGLQQACEALGEALQLCAGDDADNGRDFYDRKPAPTEYWVEAVAALIAEKQAAALEAAAEQAPGQLYGTGWIRDRAAAIRKGGAS